MNQEGFEGISPGHTLPDNLEPAQEFKLAQPPLLSWMVDRFSKHSVVDWKEIVKRIKENPRFTKSSKQWGHFVSLAAELHLRTTLEELAKTVPGRVKFDPIPDGAETDNFKFAYNGHRVIVLNKKRPRVGPPGYDIYAEYDGLIMVDDTPVVMEVSLGRKLKEKGQRMELPYELTELLKPENAKKRTNPIREFYNRPDCGYLVVVRPEFARPPISQRSLLTQARSSGSLIKPFSDVEIFTQGAYPAKLQMERIDS